MPFNRNMEKYYLPLNGDKFYIVTILWKFIITLWIDIRDWSKMDTQYVDLQYARSHLNQLCIISRAGLETSPRFRKCNGSGFGFFYFPWTSDCLWLSLLSRAIAIVFINSLDAWISQLSTSSDFMELASSRCVATERWWYSWFRDWKRVSADYSDRERHAN